MAKKKKTTTNNEELEADSETIEETAESNTCDPVPNQASAAQIDKAPAGPTPGPSAGMTSRIYMLTGTNAKAALACTRISTQYAHERARARAPQTPRTHAARHDAARHATPATARHGTPRHAMPCHAMPGHATHSTARHATARHTWHGKARHSTPRHARHT